MSTLLLSPQYIILPLSFFNYSQNYNPLSIHRLKMPLITIFNNQTVKDHKIPFPLQDKHGLKMTSYSKVTISFLLFGCVFYISCQISEKTYLSFWDQFILLSVRVSSCILSCKTWSFIPHDVILFLISIPSGIFTFNLSSHPVMNLWVDSIF